MQTTAPQAIGLDLAVTVAWLIAAAAALAVCLYLALVVWPALRDHLRPDPNRWRQELELGRQDRDKRKEEGKQP